MHCSSLGQTDGGGGGGDLEKNRRPEDAADTPNQGSQLRQILDHDTLLQRCHQLSNCWTCSLEMIALHSYMHINAALTVEIPASR